MSLTFSKSLSIRVTLVLGLILIGAWLFKVVLITFRNRFIEVFTSFLLNSTACYAPGQFWKDHF